MYSDDEHTVQRRDFLRYLGAAGLTAWLTPIQHLANQLATPARQATGPVQLIRRAAAVEAITVERLRGNVSVLRGSGGNVAALGAKDGVVLVDSGIVGAKVAAAVATVSRAPITHVINTHWHFDHTDANAWMHAHGALLIAHTTSRLRMSESTRVDDWDFTFPASPSEALPATLISTAQTLELNGLAVAIEPYAPAHTDCDLAVHLVDADILHVADTWWNGLYPFIDYSTGGSIDGTIRATERNLARVSSSTIIVPGHGAVGRRSDLARYRDMLVAVRDRVAKLKTQGRTVAETVAARPTAAFDAIWGKSIITPELFTRLIYKGV